MANTAADSNEKYLEGKVVVLAFYRATLCVSAIFAVSRCLSVRLSVRFVYCIQTAEDIVKLLSRPGSPIILVFFTPSAGTQFQGNPFNLAKYSGWENLRFLTEIAIDLCTR